VSDVDERAIAAGLERIRQSLLKGVEKGKLDPQDVEATQARLIGTTKLDEFSKCDLVVEAVVENMTVKRKIFEDLDSIVGPHAVLASNTSSLCITELATTTTRPDRFVGLHFFSPVPLMKLVEVVRGLSTSDETFTAVFNFVGQLGKEPVTASDRPGFIANRLLIPYLLDAVRAYESGLGTVEDIDKTMTLGCGHPMGPFTLLDFIGIDTTYYIAGIMYEEFGDRIYAAPPLLKRMVLAGRLGRKSGEGFYSY
jgi:3-hydroxybutyryl-CoA dehydrogenase